MQATTPVDPAQKDKLTKWAERAAESGLVDLEYYSEAAGTRFASLTVAASHYIIYGEANHLRPSESFDPQLYLSSYPDLARLDSPLLLHFADHGKGENRVGALKFDAIAVPGARPHRSDRPTMLLCTHEASVTGAPILAYNIVRELSASHNVVTMLLSDGPLRGQLAAHSAFIIAPDAKTSSIMANAVLQRRIIAAVRSRFFIDVVLANSVESAPLVIAAREAGLPVVALVHEFAEYVPKDRLSEVLAASQIVVFSSKLTEYSAKHAGVVADLRSTRILPQGKCEVPEAISAGQGSDLPAWVSEGCEDRLLIVGCGYVQIRKGVDLFISVADKVARGLGRDRVRFVWIGDGFKPDEDMVYSVWLRDQIRRSGLEDVVRIVPALPSGVLEQVYAKADAMLLPSRLDPLPNVALDAMHAGLPIVCFDRTTGVAEYLRGVEGGEALVVPYLDVDAAAGAIMNLAKDPDFRRRVQDALRSLANRSFNMHRYVERLRRVFLEARQLSEQENEDFRTLRGQGLLSEMTIGRTLGDIIGEDHRTRRYIRFTASGVQGVLAGYRRPFPGFSPQLWAIHHREVLEPPFPNPLAEWVRQGKPEGPWVRRVIELGKRRKPRQSLKVALHLHLHYPELIDDIFQRLELNSFRPDLLISCDTEEVRRLLESRLADYRRGQVIVRMVPNRGRDIGPMITEFGALLETYDVVGHVHGKKSIEAAAGGALGGTWREFLLENLIGGKTAAMDEILVAFAEDASLGLVFPEDPNVVGWTENRPAAAVMVERLGLGAELPEAIEFPVGNMFFARPAAIAPVLRSGFTWDDYPAEPVPYDGTMLHALERLVPLVCESQGFAWRTTMVDGVTR